MTPVGNVLIVEDDADTRDMLHALLSIAGFNAVAAEDGLEGLHLLRTVRHRAPDIPVLSCSTSRCRGLVAASSDGRNSTTRWSRPCRLR